MHLREGRGTCAQGVSGSLRIGRCVQNGHTRGHGVWIWTRQSVWIWMLWGLLKVFLPKACAQWSLCRWSIAQSFEATAELGLWQRVNLTNMKECDVWCDCHVWLWPWSWLDFLNLSGCMLSSRLSRTSLDLYLNLGELLVIVTGKAEAFIYKSPSYNDVICLAGSWVSWMTKHENKRYKKGNNDESMSQPGSDEWVRSN